MKLKDGTYSFGFFATVDGVQRAFAVSNAVVKVEGSLTVTQLGSSVAGYTTYQVSVDFGRTTADVYALFGEQGDPMVIPAGFQVPAPFGSDVGPVRASPKPITSHAAR